MTLERPPAYLLELTEAGMRAASEALTDAMVFGTGFVYMDLESVQLVTIRRRPSFYDWSRKHGPSR